jgi:uncharacterized protein YdaU (DUF1376 family)
MAEFPALPLFTDALLGDTVHLSTRQFGAYMLMLIVAWRSKDCALPDDDVFLAKITRMDRRSWNSDKATLLAFWKKDVNQKWVQGRLKDERKYVEEVSNKNAKNVRGRWLKDKQTGDTTVIPNAYQNDTPTPTPTPTPKKDPPKAPATGFGSDPEEEPEKPHSPKMDEVLFAQDFENFWSQWRPYDIDKGSKSAAKKSYLKIRREIEHEAIIRGAVAYAGYCHAKQQRTKHAVTWLNQHGWEDEYPDPKSEVKPAQGRPAYGNIVEDTARLLFDNAARKREVREEAD